MTGPIGVSIFDIGHGLPSPIIGTLTPTPASRPGARDPRGPTRRGLVLAAALGLTACTTAGDTLPTGSSGAMPAMSRPIQELVAVRVFPTYRSAVYGQYDAVLARLGALGVRRISHKIGPAMDPAVIEFTQRAFREHGITSWLTVGAPRVPLAAAQWDQIEGLLSGPLAGMVERCYGWNEPNYDRGGGPFTDQWPQQTAAHQSELWARVKPLGIEVGTPQLWSGSLETHDADLAVLAPLIEGTFDHIGWHLYPRGDVGIDLIEQFEATYRLRLGEFPVVCTEAGYLDAANYTGGAANLTSAQKAILVPQLIDAYTSRGYGISYFELLDDPDASASNREASLGLVECRAVDPATWVDKPAFDAFRSRLSRS